MQLSFKKGFRLLLQILSTGSLIAFIVMLELLK